jgi:hypothetical protein
MRSLIAHFAIVLLGLTISACGGSKDKGPTIGKHRAEHGYANGEISPEFRGQVPALSDASILGFLPDTTVGAWFVRSPRELEASLEFTAILSEYKEFYAELLPMVSGPAGINFLVPSTWPIFGVDPNRSAGVALLVGDSAVGVFFVSLANKELFKTSLDLLGAYTKIGPVVPASAGESTIYVFQGFDEVAIVVRGDIAMLVIPDRDRDLEAQVLAVAGTGSQPTLASSGRIAKTFAGFDHGKDMAGFLAFDTIAAKLMAERDESNSVIEIEAQAEQLRIQIAEAKAENQSKEDIARLERFLMTTMQSLPGLRRKADGELALVNDVLGAIGTVAVGVELDGKTTRLRAQFSPRPKSIPSKILQPASRPFALPGRLQESPLFLLGLHLDIDVASKVFDLIVAADGEARQSISDELMSKIGVSLDEIISLFDGELSGALTVNTAGHVVPGSHYSRAKDAMGIHLMGHLRDVNSAQVLFEKVCSQRALAGFVVERDGGKALEVESFNKRKLRIQISGDYLQAISVGPEDASRKLSTSERGLLEGPTSQGVMVLDPALMIRTLSNADRRAYNYEPRPHEGKAARARAKPIRKELGALYEKRSALQSAAYGGNENKSARFVATGHAYGNGYAVLARLEGSSKNLGRSIQSMFEAAVPEIRSARIGGNTELDAIEAQIQKLEEALWQALDGP